MPTDDTPPPLEVDIFRDLFELCTSPGYVHAIAYLCWRDNLILYTGEELTKQDLEYQQSPGRLLRTELSTLIGLMVRMPVDFNRPAPPAMQDFIDRSDRLLAELHRALNGQLSLNLTAADFSPETSSSRTVWNGAAMREPIFYCAESAYNFQYLDMTASKYRLDDPWFKSNKSFTVQEMCLVAATLGDLHNQRMTGLVDELRESHPDSWTVLPGFIFSAAEVANACPLAEAIIARVLDAFTCPPDDRNETFTALNEFNKVNAYPILKTPDGRYVLLQHSSLLEALYETPFFWLALDKPYAPTALDHRGKFTEQFVVRRLTAVFGAGHVLPNVDIYKGKDRVTEADALVVCGDRAIVVQAKSKRLTIPARQGNDRQLRNDFKLAIQGAYDQALACADALLGPGYRLVASTGEEITLRRRPRFVFPVCVVADHYPALAFQVRQFLTARTTAVIQPLLVTDVFALDAIAEMLSSPMQFLNYLALRARIDARIFISQELAALGFHLEHNLWLDEEYNFVNLGGEFTAALDIAMVARRTGTPGKQIPPGILTRFDGLTLGRLLSRIERTAALPMAGIGLILLQLSSAAAKILSEGIDRLVHAAARHGEGHDISIPGDRGEAGLTIHCNGFTDIEARERLAAHCRIRKYDTKAHSWYGILLAPGTGQLRACLAIEEDWVHDPQMDAILAAWTKRAPVPFERLSSMLPDG
jgi:hypothetical protein